MLLEGHHTTGIHQGLYNNVHPSISSDDNYPGYTCISCVYCADTILITSSTSFLAPISYQKKKIVIEIQRSSILRSTEFRGTLDVLHSNNLKESGHGHLALQYNIHGLLLGKYHAWLVQCQYTPRLECQGHGNQLKYILCLNTYHFVYICEKSCGVVGVFLQNKHSYSTCERYATVRQCSLANRFVSMVCKCGFSCRSRDITQKSVILCLLM